MKTFKDWKVEKRGDLYAVLHNSKAAGKWITMGEWKTEEAAIKDMVQWPK
jgi:hypothetical protein